MSNIMFCLLAASMILSSCVTLAKVETLRFTDEAFPSTLRVESFSIKPDHPYIELAYLSITFSYGADCARLLILEKAREIGADAVILNPLQVAVGTGVVGSAYGGTGSVVSYPTTTMSLNALAIRYAERPLENQSDEERLESEAKNEETKAQICGQYVYLSPKASKSGRRELGK